MKRLLSGVAGGLMMCCQVSDIQAAEAQNGYVHVRSDTLGVESIVAIDLDFHITTTNVPDSFCAEVYVSSIDIWSLNSPSNFTMQVGS
jgi:hypothetical protein